MTRTLWITGAAGFSGRHLAAFIATLPNRPRTVGIDIGSATGLPLDAFETLDVADATAVATLAKRRKPDWVIHLAGAPPAAPPADLWRAHVGTTLGLALGLLGAGCRRTRLLSIGSAAEYRPHGSRALTERDDASPTTEYGRSKLAQTLLTAALPNTLGLSACVARTFNLVGPGLPTRFVLGRLCDEFARVGPRGTITVQHLDSSRDFIDVRDAADAYWRLVRTGRPGRVYNVCSGRPTRLAELVTLLSAATGKHPRIRITAGGRHAGNPDVVFGSFARLARATGWTPRIDLLSSIQAMLADAGGRAVPPPPRRGGARRRTVR